MNFGLLIVGDEILSGKRADKHLPKVIELLEARGLSLSWARYVGDDRKQITADLKDAFRQRRAVFSCGGIGASRTTTPPPMRGGGARRALVLLPRHATS